MRALSQAFSTPWRLTALFISGGQPNRRTARNVCVKPSSLVLHDVGDEFVRDLPRIMHTYVRVVRTWYEIPILIRTTSACADHPIRLFLRSYAPRTHTAVLVVVSRRKQTDPYL